MPTPTAKLLFGGIVQKTSESPSDCQDAYADNPLFGRFAIADGVARSFYPAEWAKLLVEYFCNEDGELNSTLFKSQLWRQWLNPIQQKWEIEIKEKVNKKAGGNSYHLRNSFAQHEPGAAAFVGLQLSYENLPNWKAMIIGDSCLFHIRGDQLTSYLLQKPSDFNYHPEYLASVDINNKYDPKFVGGTAQVGDLFILASDALAKWILLQYESNKNEWRNTLETLIGIGNWNELYTFINQSRRNSRNPLEDDDATFMIITITEVAGHVIEPFLLRKEPMKTPAVQTSLRRPVPQTNIPPHIPRKQTPVFQEAAKDPTMENKNRGNKLVAITALLIALISLGLSALSLYLILTTSHLSEPIKTPSTPTVYPSNSLNLTPGYLIYSTADLSSPILLQVQNEVSVLSLKTPLINNKIWEKIQIDLWVVSQADNQEYASEQEGMVIILKTVNARSIPTTNSNIIGELSPGWKFQKVIEYTDFSNVKWYQIRLFGFIQRDQL